MVFMRSFSGCVCLVLLAALGVSGCNSTPPRKVGREVGDIALEIEGEDIDGKEFKLSDYRGKVVVVSFWAMWCPPCREMFDHERSLVKRMEGKPFVLLGVNGDPNREQLKKDIVEKKITWRSWWDGGSALITRRWQVEAFPTTYVIDAKGIIRDKNKRGEELDRAVEKVLSEM
jgi:thiol-disulfide isomerase/thioredoxin